MIQTFTRSLAVLEYGVASVTAPHREECCDRHLVKTIPGGTLVAVVDGVGEGTHAAAAARMAVRILESHANDDPASLVQTCHQHLTPARGVVMGLGVINAVHDTLTWLGVGNVAGTLVRPHSPASRAAEEMFLRPGIVGCRLPLLQTVVLQISPGDLIILATDGIRPEAGFRFTSEDSPRALAESIASSQCKSLDDGLVLVARYLGSSE